MFNNTATGPKVPRLLEKTSQFFAKAATIITTNSTTAARDTPGAIFSTIAGDLAVKAIPIATGNAVIKNIVRPSRVIATDCASSPMK